MPRITMHDDEIHIDVSLLRQLLKAQFPKWAKLPIKPIDSAGTDNAIFRIGSELCVRMPRIESAAKNIEKEHTWLKKLSPHLSLPISVPIEKGKPSETYRWHWSICRWLEGKNAAVRRIYDLNQCAQDLAQFLMSLWKISSSKGPPSRRSGPLIAQDQEVREALKSLIDIVDTKTITALWEECIRVPIWEKPAVWTHGDLLPTNLLVIKGRLSAVIDFDLMGVGDPACDLIAAWSVLSEDSRKIFRSMLDVDEATWTRGLGWALSIAIIIIPYYQDTNPGLTAIAHRMINEVLSEG